MKLGLHITNFDHPNGDAALSSSLKDIAQFCNENGFYSLSPMDHFFQIGVIGAPELNMLEGYSLLNYFAGITHQVKLLTMVTGVVYRHPGILAKLVTTLDVLSGARAYLGIGAAWNEREALGLGIPFPPLGERFARLEETLQIIRQMWTDDTTPYQGKHYQLAEPINHPQPISKPHPPILIGGGGEKKTLRFVAQYADACNLFLRDDLETPHHKLDVLKRHCDSVGRDFNEIERTATVWIDPAQQSPQAIIAFCRSAADLGFEHMMAIVPGIYSMRPLEILAREVIPAIAEF